MVLPFTNKAALESQDKSGSLATLLSTPGHPLALMTEENKALDALLRETKEKVAAGSVSDQDLAAVRQLSTHYEKKGDLLYPNLKVKYDISGPSMVMWTVDDDIRDQLGKLAKRKDHDKAWLEDLDGVLTRSKIFSSQFVPRTSAKKIGMLFTKIARPMNPSLAFLLLTGQRLKKPWL